MKPRLCLAVPGDLPKRQSAAPRRAIEMGRKGVAKVGDFILTRATASQGYPGYGSSIHESPEEVEHMDHSACLTTVSPVMN